MRRHGWLVLALLAGCASATEIPGPDPGGRATYLIECPGPAAAVRACLRKAHALCPSGFSILDARPPLDLSTAEPSQPGGFVRRQVTVRCFWRDPRMGNGPSGHDRRAPWPTTAAGAGRRTPATSGAAPVHRPGAPRRT